MDIAASIQKVTSTIMAKMANHVKEITGFDNLCLAGGVALNCVGNGELLKQQYYKKIWVQPASGDAGGAIGAALLAWHKLYGKERTSKKISDGMQGAYLGPSFTREETKKGFVNINPFSNY